MLPATSWGIQFNPLTTNGTDTPIQSTALRQQTDSGEAAVLVEIDAEIDPDTIASTLQSLGAQELYRVSLIYKGIAILVAPQQLDLISTLGGVRAIHPLIAKQLLDQIGTSSVTPTGIRVAYPQGASGAGVRVGVIDSGIDYTHSTFGSSQAFPSAKVSGGYDFAGNTYNPTTNPIPQPDNDPSDCNGHGTHLASTIAGAGVANGTTYTGSYDQALDLSGFSVAPGIAPQAQIYAFKVLGCNARSTLLLLPAIERALDPDGDGDTSDRLDVLLIGLGTAFGRADDPDRVAVERAVAAGISVVVGAGEAGTVTSSDVLKDGSAFYAVQSPGSATGAISVAAFHAPGTLAAGQANQPASFSSLGAQPGHTAVKPDLAAPGVNVPAAAIGTATTSVASTGTATAAAHVAGAIALLQQIHPGWNPIKLKAALINTADPFPDSGSSYSLLRGGVGSLNISRALTTPVLVYRNDPAGAVGLNFGAVRVADTLVRTQQLIIENVGTTEQQVTFSNTLPAAPGLRIPGLPNAGVTMSVTPANLVLPVGATSTVTATITVDGSTLALVRDPAIPVVQGGLPRYYLGEQSGVIAVSPTTGQSFAPVMLPYLMMAQSASAATLNTNRLIIPGGTGAALTTIRNNGARNSTSTASTRPLLSAFQLAYSSANEARSTGEANVADIEYVGIASSYQFAQQNILNSQIFFGIAAHSAWASPNMVRFEVWIDTNDDDIVDYVLANTSLQTTSSSSSGTTNDVYFATLFKNQSAAPVLDLLPTFNRFLNTFVAPSSSTGQDTAPFYSRVLFMGVNASWLGFSDTTPATFSYQVRGYQASTQGIGQDIQPIDQTPWLRFDARRPAIDAINVRNAPGISNIAGTPLYLSTNGAPIFVRTQSSAAESAFVPPALLLFFHHNDVQQQTQVVPIDNAYTTQSTPIPGL